MCFANGREKRGSDGKEEEDMSNERMQRVMRMAKRRKDRNVDITLFNVDKHPAIRLNCKFSTIKETVTNQANSKRRPFTRIQKRAQLLVKTGKD